MAAEKSLWSQITSDQKIVPSPTLNRLGLQVARALTAHTLYTLRSVPTPPSVASQVEALRRDGVLVVNDFLPESEFEAVRSEFFETYDKYRDKLLVLDSINLYEMAYLHNLPSDAVPHARKLVADTKLHTLMEGAEKRPWKKFFQFAGFEYITYGESGKPDPQITLHADAFYHTHKAWLYMEDVTPENGPFAVVKGTHRLTARQIPHIYSHSLEQGVDPSRRISKEEMERLGLEETLVTCPKNTLVIANTGAYHRRTQGKPGTRRFGVQIMARATPFVL
jgi:hypothetical protein